MATDTDQTTGMRTKSEEKEMLLDILLSSTQDAIVILDESGAVSFWNSAAETIFGFSKAEIIGRNLHDAVSPARCLEAYKKGFENFRHTGKGPAVADTEELTIRRKDGSELPVELSLSSTLLKENWYAIHIVRDITVRKKNEERIQALNRALEERIDRQTRELSESQQRLLMLMQHTPLGVIEWDPGFRVTQWNSSAERIFGYTRDEAMGRQALELIVPPTLRSEIQTVFDSLRQNVSGFHAENDNITKKGDRIRCEWYNTPLLDEKGEVVAVASLVHDITEQRHTQNELKKSEERFRSIFESTTDCILVWDREYNYLYANQAAIDHVGTTRDKVIGKNMRDGLGHVPDFMHLWMGRVDKVFATRQISRVEDTVPVGDRLTYSESVLSPLKDETGEVFAVGVVYRDITTRKEAEEELRKTKETLQTMIDSMPFGMTVIDSDKTILSANRAALKLMGYDREAEVVGMKCNSTFCPNRKTCPVLDHGKVVDLSERILLDKNGREIPIIKSAAPIQMDNREVLLEAFVDISRQKKAEQELGLREQLLAFALEQMPLPVIIASAPDVRITRFNRHALQFLAKPLDDPGAMALGEQREFWPTFHPDGTPYDVEDLPLTRAIRNREISTNVDIIIRKEDGDYWVAASAAPLCDDEGNVVAGIVVFPDITERKRTESMLKAAKKKAELASKAKSEFLANMSHEIRTPLNSVLGFSDLLAPHVRDPKQRGYLDSIKMSGSTLLNLINDILDLSRMEAGRMELQSIPVDIREFIDGIGRIFAPEAEKKSLSLFIEIVPRLPAVLYLDEIRLRQVLFNLLGNAIKFTEKGFVRMEVSTPDGHGEAIDLMITIEDSGIGIPAEDQQSIFDTFKQQSSETTRKYGGTGLGLAITKKLMELMNGTVSIESVPGRGSRFGIVLHGVPISKTKVTAKPKHLKTGSSIVRFDGGSVLIVDDDQTNIHLLRDILTRTNLSVIEAANGREAVDLALRHQPDLIIMDIMMPEMKGDRATQKLRDTPATAGIPVIALTATVAEASPMTGDLFDGYLSKPLRISTLLETLARYFTKQAQQKTDPGEFPATGGQGMPDEERIAELQEILEQEILPEISELSGTINKLRVEKLARRLISLAGEYGPDDLLDIGRNLEKACSAIDIIEMKKYLDAIPALQRQWKKTRRENASFQGQNPDCG